VPANHSARGKTRRNAWRPDAFVACALVAVLAGGLAAFAFTQPDTVAATAGRPYTQSGTLSYTAPVDPASVYGTSQAVTGEPLYTSSVQAVTFTYAYQFKASSPRSMDGTEQLVATIDNGEGLARTIDLQPVGPFKGDRFSTTATVPLSSFAAIANAFSQAGGTQGNGSYTVAISPTVAVHGKVGTALVDTTFSTPVNLTLNANGLFPPTASSASGSTPGVATTPHPFSVTSSGSVTVPVQRPNVLFLHLAVSTVRTLAAAVFLACLVLCLLVGLSLLRDSKDKDEDIRIAARYASLLVEVTSLPSSVEMVTVSLRTIADLVEVGRRLETPILHESGATDTYAVIDNGVLYTYRTGPVRHRGRSDSVAATQNGRVNQTV
jgi:Family of unknown function (DUF5305)